jgi:hypothetical protein
VADPRIARFRSMLDGRAPDRLCPDEGNTLSGPADPMDAQKKRRPQGRADRCPAATHAGKPCGHPAGYGTDHKGFGLCKFHGGASPGGKKQGARLRAMGEFGSLLEECGVLVEGRSHFDALTDALDRAGRMVVAWGLKVEELDDDSKWEYVEVKGPQGSRQRWVTVEKLGVVGPNAQGEQRINVAVEQYGLWLDRYGRLAKMAADLGLEDRRVRVEERQADLLGQAVEAMLAELGVDPVKGRKVLAKQLRLIEGGAA